MSPALALAPVLLLSVSAVPQTIRIWGPAAMTGIVTRWAQAYSRDHRDVKFELVMKGSDTAVPGLYSGRADIALMGREDDDVDDNGFSRPIGYALTRIAITSGSLASPGKSDALAIMVQADNPLAGLTLSELGRILDCGTDAPEPTISRWGELGLSGKWAMRPIHVYTYDMATRTGAFLQHKATGDRRRMCWERISEFADGRRLDGTLETAAERIAAAARFDPDALAIANAAQAVDGLRLVALGSGREGAFILPTRVSVSAQTYPLARRTYALVNRRPGAPVDRTISAFLSYVLSPAGQALLEADRGYLPLDAKSLGESRAVLGGQ